ncbi:hypothetical protein, partial [Agriterribacter sp.]|uniref:hypothetical protein n=1 Tax=Agriterribacter sp. TaxID=2821509 RepID=UPI002BAF2F47
MLLRKARYRRRIAATLMAVMLSNTILPVISYALTSGPTAPEATSFEPIDTTDMVNLQTGDFTYNMPLLEVPGPEGGYPLSLSYHAGIQPNEDASWVGLGWTLNPGAINRNVNGYPDDWYNPQNNSHVYMEEGITKTYDVGVNIGIANTPVSVGVNLSFSQDDYRGFGVGGSVSAGRSWGLGKASINASIGVGVSPYGGAGYVFGGVGIAVGGAINASAGIGFSTNFESLNAGVSGGVGYSFAQSDKNPHHGIKGSLLNASISTGGGKPSISAAGITSSVSASEGAGMQYDVSSFSVDIPVYYFNLSLGYSKTRSWIDKSTNVYTHGSIYGSGWGEISETIGGNSMTNMVAYDRAFDTYALLEDPAEKNIVDYPDPSRVQGGAYPDFDNYRVLAQGLGGSMRPYLFQGEVLGQNRKKADGSRSVNYYSPGVTNVQPQFRFEGDFSNSYRQNYSPYSNPALNLRSVATPFATPTYGDGDGAYGYSGGKLAGTKHIDIGPTVKPSNSKGYSKSDRYLSYMIEGFSITNESGVTYHYGLPAYSYGEENYQEKIKNSGFNKVYFNRGTKSTPYAYTWYLTTITGPDFVDRNGNGIADGNDWGYWVNFEYGKWSNNYVWRNPSEGYHRDEDNEFQNCSMGMKEVYYLNAIRTRSHIALFEKDIRLDGKGASSSIFTKNTKQDYQYAGLFNSGSARSLRLDRIYLLNASDSLFVLPSSGSNNAYSPNVLDKADVDAANRYALEDKAIRIINFSYDYSLCPNTTNSFDSNTPTVKSGKLTLKNLLYRGKGGQSLIPPTRFEYEIPETENPESSGIFSNGSLFNTQYPYFEVGDLLVTNDVLRIFCGVVTKKTLVDPGNGMTAYELANSNMTGTLVAKKLVKTKNPPYNKDACDIWGYYKSDSKVSLINSNENLGRRTTPISAKSVDAWSLRRIVSEAGSITSIHYEPKNYSKSALSSEYPIALTNIQQVSGHTNQLRLDYSDDINLSDYYNLNDRLDFLMLLHSFHPNSVINSVNPCMWRNIIWTNETYDTKNSTYSTLIKEIGTNYVIVENNDFSDFYQSPISVVFYGGTRINTVCGSNRRPFAGNIKLVSNPNIPFWGDGLRVNKISVADQNGDTEMSTSYLYRKPDAPTISSGTTCFEPWVMENVYFLPNAVPSGFGNAEGVETYKRRIFKNLHSLLVMAREIPPPGVMHEYVTVTSSIKSSGETVTRQVVGSTTYQFEVFRENMIYRNMTETPYTHNVVTGFCTADSRNISIKKFLHSVGATKRIIQYDKDGKKLSETINNFLHDGLQSLSDSLFFVNYKGRLSSYSYMGNTYNLKYQGFLQERYSEVKTVDELGWTTASQVKATMSAREDYPCVPLGQTVINYVNGTQTTSQNLAYDFYSGALTKSVETDAYGNRFVTETTPAYRKYSSMGLKIGSSTNKNMLTQTAASYTYKVDATNPNTNLGLVSASVTTWSNTLPALDMAGASVVQNTTSTGYVWRPQYSYSWMPVSKTTDGLTPVGSFVDFNWTTPASSNANWKKTSDITQYDVFSKALEAMDINGNYAATRMNYQSKKVELSGSPAKFYEIAFSG